MDEHSRLLLTEAYNRLKELNNSFNMTRVIMDDPDLRKEAGDMVRENREFLDRLFGALAFKPAHSVNPLTAQTHNNRRPKMGLATSHDAWHGAYSAFMRWREKLAEVAGLPPLQLMEGYFVPQREKDDKEWNGTIPTVYLGPSTDEMTRNAIGRIEATLPIRWEVLKPSPLHELLYHSDCDGEIPATSCGPIADELEKLLPLLPDEDGGGHIGIWRAKTQQFIDGLRRAAAANEPLDFH